MCNINIVFSQVLKKKEKSTSLECLPQRHLTVGKNNFFHMKIICSAWDCKENFHNFAHLKKTCLFYWTVLSSCTVKKTIKASEYIYISVLRKDVRLKYTNFLS